MVRGGCAIIGWRCRIDKDLGDDQDDLGDDQDDLGDDQDDLGDHGLKKGVGRRRMRYNWVEVLCRI